MTKRTFKNTCTAKQAMFLRNDTPRTCHSEGRKPHPLAYSAYTPRTLKDSSPSLKMRADKSSHPITKSEFFCWNSEEHSDFQSFRRKIPDFVLAAFFLSLVAFLSFWSQQKERNEQNNSLRNGIFRSAQHDALKYRHSANCLSLRQRRNGTNRDLKEEARRAHPQGVLIYTAYACI